MHESERQNLRQISNEDRYGDLVRKAADFEQVWGLYDDGWALAGDSGGGWSIPIWPEAEFVADCATIRCTARGGQRSDNRVPGTVRLATAPDQRMAGHATGVDVDLSTDRCAPVDVSHRDSTSASAATCAGFSRLRSCDSPTSASMSYSS